MNIQGYGPYNVKPSLGNEATKTGESGKGQFAEVLKEYASDMNTDVKAASKQAEHLAVTGEGNMSETLIAMKQANLSFQLMLSARNKMMDAYREVIRMQV